MSVDDATVSATLEPSGEIRVVFKAPWRHGSQRREALTTVSKGAGCAALVYSGKVREKPEKRAGFGALGRATEFGRHAKRKIKSAVGALETMFNRRVVFATVTLPGSTDEARLALASWSSKAVELLTHWIRYTAPGSMYCYVWEHQKNGALHLHAAIANDDVLKLRRLERSFKAYCHRMFTKLSALSRVDLFARADGGSWSGAPSVLRSNCVPVKKSVKRYMAKYLAKQGAAVRGYCPARYWGCSAELRALMGGLRCCTRRSVSNWGLLKALQAGVTAIAVQRGCKLFEYSPVFSPTSRTLLVYPDEARISDSYAAIVEFLLQSNENFTERHDHEALPVLGCTAGRLNTVCKCHCGVC